MFFKSLKAIVITASLAVGAVLVAAGCGGSTNAASPPAKALPDVTLNYQIVGADDGDKASDGATHDTFKLLNPQTVLVGQKVTVSIANKDDGQHSFTLPDLGINLMVPGAKDGQDGTVSYTFTPKKAGSYRWFCAIPCDTDNNGWAMKAGTAGPDQDNFMAGYITVAAS